MIEVNQALPAHTFSLLGAAGMTSPTTEDLFAGKTVVLFAVPGAFTPTCSAAHLPGFVALADKFMDAGIDDIICLSVNDAFVMKAWGDDQNAEAITMLADGDGTFSKTIGLAKDTGSFGGVRSKRYALVAKDAIVTHLFVEQDKAFEVSSAEAVLAAITE